MGKKKRRGAGEGTVIKRKDGRWMGAAIIGFDVETGTPKRKYFYGKTQGEVLDKLEKAKSRIKSGIFTEPSKQFLAKWLDTWINDYMKNSLRPTTWDSYLTQINKHIKPNLGHIRLNQLQTAHLQKLYTEKLTGGRADKKKGGLSPRSVRYIHAVIHGALEQAKREGLIILNPADAVKLPKEDKKELQILEMDNVKKFLNAARETRLYPAYLLELATGLRRGELLALRWKDVDLENGSVTVNRGLVRVREDDTEKATKTKLAFHEPKTPLANRTISIPQPVVKELEAHKTRQDEEKESAGEAYQKTGLVFSTVLGAPIDPRNFIRQYESVFKKYNDRVEKIGKGMGWDREAIKAEKLPKVNFHALRHTHATLSLQEGVDIKTIQENLGHHAASFTLDTYSDVTRKMKQDATDKIGRLLTSCMDE